MKFIVFSIIILSFSTLNGYSQYLKSEDIDIYINGAREISDFVAERREIKMEYEKYMTDVYKLFFMFHTIISEDYLSNEELSRNIDIFNNFLNIKIEDEYEKAFRKIGWDNNGHQKYWIIYFGIISITTMYNHIEDSYKDQGIKKSMIKQYYRILEFINEDDFEKINDRIEDIVDGIRN
jgi:hypothetical protein